MYRLIFRYFIHEHLHFLENSLYIHMDIVTLEYLYIHVSPSSLCLHIYSFHVFFALTQIHGNSYYLTFIHISSLAWLHTEYTFIYTYVCDVGIIVRKFFKEINNLTHFDWNLQASSRPLTYLKHAVPIYCILNTSWK